MRAFRVTDRDALRGRASTVRTVQTLIDYRPADWAPLQRALTSEYGVDAARAARAFWFMGYVAGPADVGELRVYKHSVTRRLLALDRHGAAYRWMPDYSAYRRITCEDAFVEALAA